MHESQVDTKWLDEEGGYDREDREGALEAQYNELKAKYEELLEQSQPVELEAVESSPSETELVIVALLMRLYDINMALLTHFNEALADKVYDKHEAGGNANPPVYIPKITTDD